MVARRLFMVGGGREMFGFSGVSREFDRLLEDSEQKKFRQPAAGSPQGVGDLLVIAERFPGLATSVASGASLGVPLKRQAQEIAAQLAIRFSLG